MSRPLNTTRLQAVLSAARQAMAEGRPIVPADLARVTGIRRDWISRTLGKGRVIGQEVGTQALDEMLHTLESTFEPGDIAAMLAQSVHVAPHWDPDQEKCLRIALERSLDSWWLAAALCAVLLEGAQRRTSPDDLLPILRRIAS